MLGQMDVPIDFDDLKVRFEKNKTYLVNYVMLPHIPFNVKRAGLIPRKVGDFLPLSRFKNYFKNTVYGLHKVLGSDGAEDCVYGSLFLIACDIQDPFHHKEYDYVAFIINNMHKQICDAKRGVMNDFKFHNYSLLMHLILY